MLKNVLIANRGEIAVRIIRACRDLKVGTVAVYSDADEHALHVRLADAAFRLGPAPARDSYLNIDAIIAAARASGADAVHPGYGMLSENAAFAQAVADAGLIFIGPPADVIGVMGDKVAARAAAHACGLPILPGADVIDSDAAGTHHNAERIGYPIAVKACFGGGGRGIRAVHDATELDAAFASAVRESINAFGRGEIYLERYLDRPRHVEVQIVADNHGNVLHLGDRDCSVQRRHQKLVEEAPAPNLPTALREEMLRAAVTLAQSVKYVGAGTVEFLVDHALTAFYFLEMNTRLQVEHGVTELVTGRDIVKLQLRIAAGERLGLTQKQVRVSGHAIQARIAAEDPWRRFAPQPGRCGALRLPGGRGVRCDFGIESNDAIAAEYDSMFGKILVVSDDRESACAKLVSALTEFSADGVVTTAPYLAQVLVKPDFAAATHDTGSVERDWAPEGEQREPAPSPTSIRPAERRVNIATDRGVLNVRIGGLAHTAAAAATGGVAGRQTAHADARAAASADPISPMDGLVISVAVNVGDIVTAGDLIATLEAMKMEMPILAQRAGQVAAVNVRAGDAVTTGARLCTIAPAA
ncbi:biotin carboxylase of acetyl-CoA carboxylase [alpha proteobacterium U9-1i]|nr:biotin carboxylase of acetyl-CoA carboxylase [alpha proteobacterium U9-1i]